MLATVCTQSSIVVLAPLIVAIGRNLGASVSAVGVARAVLAGVAVAVSLLIGPLIDRVGVRPLLISGAALALAGAAATAAAPSLPLFYLAHAITGSGVACLLSAGFAGIAATFSDEDASWAMGYVVGAQSLAWIVGNPLIGLLADAGGWRLAYLVPGSVAAAALLTGRSAPRTRGGAEDVGGPLEGLATVLREPSARRWVVAELVAYSAWTAELTFAGAFYIQMYGVDEAVVGSLLAIGSVVFLASSLSTERLVTRLPRRPVLVCAAVGMGVLFVPVLGLSPSVGFTLGLFCLLALCAGVRSTGSSALGLVQLPGRPGAMMGARTASAQLGYLVGALVGGAVLALSGFGTLGLVLFAGMTLSAALLSRVSDPQTAAPRA
ncbi:MAG TPA: MFS transporter [Thermoleophilaceae bacterium]|nr:MFS transporter [Thermoleophilaceae bacterium]